MIEFDDSKLRNEETLAGFNPGEPDDDTFTLPDSGYPDSIPHLSDAIKDDTEISEGVISEALDLPPKVSAPIQNDENLDLNETLSKEVTSAEQIDVPDEGSVWDAFGFDSDDDTPSDAVAKSVVDDDIDNVEFIDSSQKEEVTQIPEQKFDEPKIEAKDIEAETEITESNIEPDNDLQSIIQKDFDRSKKRRKSQSDNADKNIDNRTFVPVDNESDATLIDLSKINLDDENSSKSTKSKQKVDIPDKKVISEDKHKQGFPWKLAAISSAALFLLTLGLIAFYILFYKPTITSENGLFGNKLENNNIGLAIDSNIQKPNLEKKSDKDVQKEPDESSDIEISKELSKEQQDSINAAIETYKEELAAIEAGSEIKIDQTDYNINSKNQSNSINSKDNKALADSKPKKKVTPVAKSTKKDKPKETIILRETNDIAEASKIDEKTIKTLNEIEEEGTYVVQIYSSPSKEDAEEWLRKLSEKGINGSISEHKIRDIIWYRVRFGEFNSKDEARSAAMRNGFAQSWIDRIK